MIGGLLGIFYENECKWIRIDGWKILRYDLMICEIEVM